MYRIILACMLTSTPIISTKPNLARIGLNIATRAPIKRLLFPPKDDAQSALIELINAEKQEIRAAIYSITDTDVANALIERSKKGVRILIVTDSKQSESEHSKVKRLARSGILVYLYPPSRLMHNKFALFARTIQNKRLYITGSYNWSDAAAHRNEENILIMEDDALYLTYHAQLGELIKKSRLLRCA